MKSPKLYTKLLLAGSLLVASSAFTSCEDFLTILPTDQIPEESFWQDKADLENVRAGAYEKLTQSGQTSRILMWGEIRSDNLELNNMSQTTISYLQSAVLQPTEAIFDWSGFYTGINYCNLVLEQGEAMTVEGKEVDPSFTRRDWNIAKSEVMALRALYYFYLVRAYRDVPFVTKSVRTDAQARNERPEATPGVAILGELISELEANVGTAAENYGNQSDNKGRFTKRSIHALLADMYLWRGCLLKKFMDKTNHGKVNMSDVLASASTDVPSTPGTDTPAEGGDVVSTAEGTTAVSDSYVTADGTPITQAYCDGLAEQCFQKAQEHAQWCIDAVRKDYNEEYKNNTNMSEELKTQPYPLYRIENVSQGLSFTDEPYNRIFGTLNSRESIFELQYNGVNTYNSTISTYLSGYGDSGLAPGYMTISPSLIASANAVDPTVGFGKTDVRLAENCYYQSSETRKPITKFIARSISLSDPSDITKTELSNYTFRRSSDLSVSWPVYRLADVMLIKAEAIARSKNPANLEEGYRLVNELFKRNNPLLKDPHASHNPAVANTEIDEEFLADRVCSDFGGTYDADGNRTFSKKQEDLLPLVYRERQREFIGEGKRWFDIVRQVEATNDPKATLTDYMTVSNSVRTRLSQLYAFYNPIYSEEIKVNGIETGGKLVQNPVWDRYTKK